MANEQLLAWFDAQAERVSARQRAQVDTAKLLVTFGVGIAATLTATALQVGNPGPLDLWATIILAVTVALAVVAFLEDRLREPPHGLALEEQILGQWTAEELLADLRTKTLTICYFNDSVVFRVRLAAAATLGAAVTTGVLAAVSLLTEGR